MHSNENLIEDTLEVETKALKKNESIINKRIDFDKRTLKRIEMMMPVYSDELDGKITNNDILALIVSKGIDSLFEGDFKRRLEEM